MDKEKMKKEIGKMLERMQEGSDNLKDTLEDTLEEAKGKVKETRYRANKYILENPERSVLISAGVGAVIGMTIAMIMRKKGHCRNFKDSWK